MREILFRGKRKMDENRINEIKSLIYKTVKKLGGGSDILSIIGGWDDTLSTSEFIEELKAWLENNTNNYLIDIITRWQQAFNGRVLMKTDNEDNKKFLLSLVNDTAKALNRHY